MCKSPVKTIQVYCGELCRSSECGPDTINLVNYRVNDLEPNVKIGYEGFISDPKTLSDRVLDLLQISAMVFCADRMARRGERDSVNYKAWSRSFSIHISVLDFDFWNTDKIKSALSEALCFMTGDRSFNFIFYKAEKGHIEEKKYQQLQLFSEEAYKVPDIENYDVVLFSGGLDSLAGVLEKLVLEKRKVISVSHKSSNNVVHLQKRLIDRLNQDYDRGVLPYGFSCHNKGMASLEETQRTRMFLFSAIAFAISQCFDKHRFYVYENGVTSLNFSVQTDVINARASRTTHPKTLGLLERFYKLFDNSFEIVAPYCRQTKEDIIKVFQKLGRLDLISSAVSCSATRNNSSLCPHCGCCSQCIDRRFAVFAAGVSEFDGEYAEDFIHKIKDQETSQRLNQQMRFASAKDYQTIFDMMKNFGSETQDAVSFWPCDNPEDSLQQIHDLLMRYGDSVMRAAMQIQLKYEDLRSPIAENSFLKIISNRDYLKTPFQRRIEEIDKKLQVSIPLMFNTEKPKNENDFNDKIISLLKTADERWLREYPTIAFGITSYRGDGYYDGLIIESKYIRTNTSPSKVVEGIAADITQISEEQNVFFVVYDPERRIIDDERFCNSFMKKKPNCVVKIYR